MTPFWRLHCLSSRREFRRQFTGLPFRHCQRRQSQQYGQTRSTAAAAVSIFMPTFPTISQSHHARVVVHSSVPTTMRVSSHGHCLRDRPSMAHLIPRESNFLLRPPNLESPGFAAPVEWRNITLMSGGRAEVADIVGYVDRLDPKIIVLSSNSTIN